MDQLIYMMDNYPIIKHCVAAMVMFRLIFKPLFAILSKYVELTIEEDDNKKLHKFMQTKTYKMLAFCADLIASVKLPKVEKKDK